MSILKGQKAQAAIELAVFGAILVFALGSIIRASIGRGNQQNAILKATRLALIMSYDTSTGTKVAARNSATILIIEDRLVVGSSKYGPIDRAPSIMSASGTHSTDLFMPVDFGDAEDLPLYDLFVNGQHFSMTTAAFKTVDLFAGGGSCGTLCRSRIWDNNATSKKVTKAIKKKTPPNGCVTRSDVACYREVCTPCPEIELSCVREIEKGVCANRSICPPCSDCSATSFEIYTIINPTPSACVKLYSIVNHSPNSASSDKWCDGTCPNVCTVSAVPRCNLSADQRFDLDRDGTTDVTTNEERRRFSWQWYLVMGVEDGEDSPPDSSLKGSMTKTDLTMGEGINSGTDGKTLPKNLQLDVDEDLKIESIRETRATKGTITSLDVWDFQDGDIDFTFNEYSRGIQPGLERDINIYTKVARGTYLRLEEGKLFSITGDQNQYIRTASKKDTADIIERVFKLSNHTGRLCISRFVVNKAVSPSVEECGACFGRNITKTCVEIDKAVHLDAPLLYIRSRIKDYHGHKWVTKTTGDPYIEFLK